MSLGLELLRDIVGIALIIVIWRLARSHKEVE